MEAYFRSLRPKEEIYWKVMYVIDSTLNVFPKDKAESEKLSQYARATSDISSEFSVLMEAIVFS